MNFSNLDLVCSYIETQLQKAIGKENHFQGSQSSVPEMHEMA